MELDYLGICFCCLTYTEDYYRIKTCWFSKNSYFCRPANSYGGLAQLARALAWHARGHRFDSGILHLALPKGRAFLF